MSKAIEILKEGIQNRDRGDKLTDRQKKNRIKKDLKKLGEVLESPTVKNIRINIEWKKSRTWGSNPILSAEVEYNNGTYESLDGYKASGCGYDKESTVLASMLNDVMQNLLINNLDKILKDKENQKLPYGISEYTKRGFLPTFSGGIGLSCYFDIMKYLGYTLEHVASGDIFDSYKITLI